MSTPRPTDPAKPEPVSNGGTEKAAPSVVSPPVHPRRRDYDRLIKGLPEQAGESREELMRSFVDAAWAAFSALGVSWIGFYAKGDEEGVMVLVACRDKPACSPIGLHGACGRSWSTKRILVVTDVAHLGAGYIACDPRDRSEVVVPLFNADGSCWGVLDVDSFDVNAFNAEDARGFWKVCLHLGLTAQPLVARLPAAIGIDVV